jgi:hypothetical protein
MIREINLSGLRDPSPQVTLLAEACGIDPFRFRSPGICMRKNWAKLLPNALTVFTVAGITAADVYATGEMPWYKISAWFMLWVIVLGIVMADRRQ